MTRTLVIASAVLLGSTFFSSPMLGSERLVRENRLIVDKTWTAPTDLGSVAGVAWDPTEKTIWALHRGERPVRRFDTQGNELEPWARQDVDKAHQIRIRGDQIWIVDEGSHTVRKFSRTGELLRLFGTRNERGTDANHFDRPTDVAFASSGESYVSDGYGNSRIVRFDERGHHTGGWGRLGGGAGEFRLPHSIVIDSLNRTVVADRANQRIQIFDLAGHFLHQTSEFLPWTLTLGPDRAVYACGSSKVPRPRYFIPALNPALGIPPPDQLVVKLDERGHVEHSWSIPQGKESGEVQWVHALAFDSEGRVYLGDIEGKRLQRFLIP